MTKDNNAANGDVADGTSLIVRGFGLNAKMQGIVVRVLWVLAVSGHIAWVCGWLTPMRVAPPFVNINDAATTMQEERDRRVADRRELEGAIGDIRKNANAALGISINHELRDQMTAFCFANSNERIAMRQYIDYLENLYQALHQKPYDEPPCGKQRR